jgi:hypothetical protein
VAPRSRNRAVNRAAIVGEHAIFEDSRQQSIGCLGVVIRADSYQYQQAFVDTSDIISLN